MAQNRVDAFINGQTPAVQPIVRRLRALVQTTLPELVEHLDGNDVLRYGPTTKMRDFVCYISGHKAHANLGFAHGASLPDPDGLIEGTGKNLRHVKVRTVGATAHPGLKQLLEEASWVAHRPGAG